MTPSVSPDPRFRAWLAERAPRLAPPGLLEASLRAATAVPQGGRWILRWPILRFATPIAATVGLLAVIGMAVLFWPPPIAVVVPSPSAVPADATTPATSPTQSLPTSTPGATAVPTPEPIDAFREWTRVDMPDPAPDYLGVGTPVGMVRLGDRYVVVGAIRTSDPRAVVWTSANGRDWQLEDDPTGLDALAVTHIVTDGARLLVLGTPDLGSCCLPPPEPAHAWVSTDGRGWTLVAADGLETVAGGPSGFVGVFADDRRVRFARSSDGVSWTDESASFSVDAGVTDLAMDVSGEAVAIGHVTVPSGDGESYATHIVAWRGIAGSAWDAVGILAENAAARAIVAGPDGFIVVGHQTIDRVDGSVVDSARIWRLTSSRLDMIPLEFAPGQTLDRVFRIGDDLVATGIEMTELGDSIMAWQSSDGGASWARIPIQPALEGNVTSVTAMVGGTDHLVAVGQGLDPESGHLVPVAWVAVR